MNKFDYVVIGSGLNSLVAATLLAKAGHRVCARERSGHLGGCILSDDTPVGARDLSVGAGVPDFRGRRSG